jgi:hemoglobin/transferrin/lactoferrin receptor protein
MNHYILVVILTLFSFNGISQTIQVRDKHTHQPLELVTIIAESSQINTITNMKGQSDLSEFIGVEQIAFRLIGYETIVASYDDLKSKDFKIYMEQTELSLDEVVVSAT